MAVKAEQFLCVFVGERFSHVVSPCSNCFVLLNFEESLYILDSNSLLGIWIT